MLRCAALITLLVTAAAPQLLWAAPRATPAAVRRERITTKRLSDLDAALEVLRAALHDSDYATRLMAVEALGAVRSIDVTPWLAHALGDPEHDVRVAAIEALRRIGSPAAGHLLRTVVDDDHEQLDLRALAASALLSTLRTTREAP